MGTVWAQLLAEDGVEGCFAGAYVRTAWMTAGGVIYWLVLEETQQRLRSLLHLVPKMA